jgi:hypothetical protein
MNNNYLEPPSVGLESLPEHILENIFNNCDYHTLKNIKKVNTKIINDKIFYIKKLEYKRKKLLKNKFNEKLLKYLDDEIIFKLKKVSFIQNESHFFINPFEDFIKINHFTKSPYIYGYNSNNNFLFSILLQFNHNNRIYKNILTLYEFHNNFFLSDGIRLKDHFNQESISFDTDDIYNNEFLNTYLSLLKNKYCENNCIDDIFSYNGKKFHVKSNNITYNIADL